MWECESNLLVRTQQGCGVYSQKVWIRTLFFSLCASLFMRSGGTFPDDDGSRQEVKNTLFVGESRNRGMPDLIDQSWGPGGLDHLGRSLPRGV